jgi:hypothetical protein
MNRTLKPVSLLKRFWPIRFQRTEVKFVYLLKHFDAVLVNYGYFFTDDELDMLSTEVDRQLQELRQIEVAVVRGEELEPGGDLRNQQETIERLTKEPVKTVMARVGRAAKSEICGEDGLLYKQWEKWGDFENKDALKIIAGILAGMGITGNAWPTVTVAVVVIIARIGRRAFCEDYGDK